jgi:hypothetical protein
MKVRLGLVILLVVSLAVFTLGCPKTTGGGWFYDEDTGDKITFGFNAKPVGAPYNCGRYGDEMNCQDAKGKFQLVDHNDPLVEDDDTVVHGSFFVTVEGESVWGYVTFGGTCRVNGTGEYDFDVVLYDEDLGGLGQGDWVELTIYNVGGENLYYSGNVAAGGGNIKIHSNVKLTPSPSLP